MSISKYPSPTYNIFIIILYIILILDGPETKVENLTLQSSFMNETKTIICARGLESNPPAIITWTNPEGDIVKNGTRYSYQYLIKGPADVTLTIFSVNEKDNGTWGCNISVKDGENEIGRMVMYIKLGVDGIGHPIDYRRVVIIVITIIFGTAIMIIIMVPGQRRVGKPANLRVSDVGFDSINLEWMRPTEGGDDITSYTIYCRSENDPQDQWQSKWTSAEERVKANGLTPKTCYCFKVRPESGGKHGEESDVTDPIETKSNVPGNPRDKPTALHVTHDRVLLAWHEPDYGADLIKRYVVSYRPTDGEWKSVLVEGNHCNVSIDKLESETEYVFKVCCEGEFGIGPESDLSYQIQTLERLSKKFKNQSKKVSLEGNIPEIYALPLTYAMKKAEDGKNIAKCVIGDPPPQSFNEKVLMLVGATGAGKTTLLNGIANYVLGVRLEDNFRFKVDTDDATLSKAHSKASWITAYSFYPMQGSPLPFSLTVIDTPGFGDTRGITRDKQIVAQLRHFFSIEGEHGIGPAQWCWSCSSIIPSTSDSNSTVHFGFNSRCVWN